MSRTRRRIHSKPYLLTTREEYDSYVLQLEEGQTTTEQRSSTLIDRYGVAISWKWTYRWWGNDLMFNYRSYEHYVANRTARHFSDNIRGDHTTPKWFRKMLNRRIKASHNQSLRNAIINGTEDELLLRKDVKDAGWYWW